MVSACAEGRTGTAAIAQPQTGSSGSSGRVPPSRAVAGGFDDEWQRRTSRVPAAERGQISIADDTTPHAHELATASRLAAYGYQVHFRPIDRSLNAKNPDAEVDGLVWEMKSPRGASEKNTISEQFKSAKRQSENLIIDLARIGLPNDVAVEQIKRRFYGQSKYRRVMILDIAGNLIHLP